MADYRANAHERRNVCRFDRAAAQSARNRRLAIWQGKRRYADCMATIHTEPGRNAMAGRAEFGQASASAMSMKWSALHDAAGVVATLSGLAPETMTPALRNFPAVMRDAGGWRRSQAEQGIEDLSAIMEPGLSALLAVHARGASPMAAAKALWQEFLAARDALLALAPPAGGSGPLRSA